MTEVRPRRRLRHIPYPNEAIVDPGSCAELAWNLLATAEDGQTCCMIPKRTIFEAHTISQTPSKAGSAEIRPPTQQRHALTNEAIVDPVLR